MYKEALKFIETNDFEGKKVALFISSVESRDEAIAKYVKRILEKYPHLRPVTFEVFGGRMKILGRTATDKRDIERVKSWVEEVGRILME